MAVNYRRFVLFTSLLRPKHCESFCKCNIWGIPNLSEWIKFTDGFLLEDLYVHETGLLHDVQIFGEKTANRFSSQIVTSQPPETSNV